VSGDELVGRLVKIAPENVLIETFGVQQSLPWNQIVGLDWRQPDKQIAQSVVPRTGVVAEVELQSFVDRPECEAEHWRVTVLRVDLSQLVVQHALVGEMRFPWSDIRRVKIAFFGKSLLVDARSFHLGNSIRSDFHRHLPDGIETHGEFVLKNVSARRAYLTLDAADADLRAGRLTTDLYINQQRICCLNSMVRLKANPKDPDRLRLEIPLSALIVGNNTYQLRQQPSKPGGREYDDCELGDFRLELED
jgi:hypothetical protein